MSRLRTTRILRLLIAGASCCAAFLAACDQASSGEPLLSAVLIGSGFNDPLYVTHAPGDRDRIFVVEQAGVIRIVDISQNPPVTLATPFLDIRGRVDSSDLEQGLLGLAFHPQFDANGFFYVNYTSQSTGGDTVVSRFSVPSGTPNSADSSSEVFLMTISQPAANHNAGWMAFGPDGFLYIATGDGGGSGDSGDGHTLETGNAQDVTENLLGKILRIDVDGSNAPSGTYGIPADNPFVGVSGDDEIWSYGLRNPWRNAFDSETGDLYIADVGQSNWEEANFQPADSTGGENWGWRCREGMHDFNLSDPGCATATLIDPIHEYSHSGFIRCSITGGEVYRGCAMPELRGAYFFGDWCSGQVWTLRYDGATASVLDRTAELSSAGVDLTFITSFGRDADGEVYVCSSDGGVVYKFVPVSDPVPCAGDVPAVSTWGMAALLFGLALAATLMIRHRSTRLEPSADS